jgi:hypothetical protein
VIVLARRIDVKFNYYLGIETLHASNSKVLGDCECKAIRSLHEPVGICKSARASVLVGDFSRRV